MEPIDDSAQVERVIFMIRGTKVMLSTDLAGLYEVQPKVLVQAVKRNIERFPPDFMFQLTIEEAEASRSQIVTLKRGQNIKYAPYAFTEQGVAMLSSVLKSTRAIQVNIAIMRAFVKLRETLALHRELAAKLQELERRIEGHDCHIQNIFDAIQELTTPPKDPPRQIGFRP
ncbi:MAG: ORF6N domain-containing protein [Elusimicrobia bacterium]|nr:ORF6N domain-containing protein [Elusimicrobiota bacterium]